MKRLALILGVLLSVGCSQALGDVRGVRTNNPGNIVKTPITWQGEVECEDKVNECFVSPYYGIRAMAKVLHTYYYKHGLGTIAEIMDRFSEFRGAAAGVAAISGLPKDETLDFSDFDTVLRLSKAIIVQENGYNPYSDELITQVLYDTYGDNHFGSVNVSERPPKDMEQEAGHAEGAARPDDASPRRQHEGTEGDSADRRSGVQLDPQDNRVVVCICNSNPSQGGGSADAARAYHSWVDRIIGWIAVFLSGERGQADVARSKGVCTYSP
jgi:hypothetical protein